MLRTLVKSDIPSLCTIELATQQSPWSRETFTKCLEANTTGWVIMQPENNIIGFIIVIIQLDECHILNLCVDPTYQNQGYGTKLISNALKIAKEKGTEIAYLEVRRSNQNAIKLYEKMGFHKIGERKDYYQTANGHEDACVFAMKLP